VSERKRGHLLATLLFTDIVGSTELADGLGDRRWRELLARHHAIVRRQLKAFNGRELDTAGDGFFAAFTSPADAVRCACQVSDAVKELGIEIRAGLHMGEAELFGAKLSGVAVHIAARTMATAGPGDVVVSGVVKDLVRGAGFGFEDRGAQQLKGVPGEIHLYLVIAVDGRARQQPLDPSTRSERLALIQPPRVSRRARIPLLAGGVAAGIALVVVIGLVAASSGPTGKPSPGGAGATGSASPNVIPVEENSVLRIDPKTDTASADIGVGAQPVALAFSNGYVWVVNRQDHTISQIDPKTNRVISTEGGLTGPCNLAADPDGGVWVTNCLAPPYEVVRITAAGELDDPIAVPDVPAGVVVGAGAVWVVLLPPTHPRGTVLRIDPSTKTIVDTFRVGRGAEYVAFDEGLSGEGTVWVGNVDDDTVSRIDSSANQVEATIPVGTQPFQVTVGGGFIWVNNRSDHSISKIDPLEDRVVGIVEHVRGTMVATDGALWVADPEKPTLWRIDMDTGRVVAEFHLRYSGFLAAGAGSIWISAPRTFDDQCCP
jgi:YVTN family beta-propeller protein